MNNDKVKILIAVPCFDHCPVEFVQCLCALEKVGQTDICFQPNSLIFDARNKLMMKAIQDDYDWVLWIDSDMLFDSDVLIRMLQTAKETDSHMVCGQFFSRRGDFKPAIFDECRADIDEHNEVKPTVHNYFGYPRDGKPFEVEACGFAGVLTSVPMLDVIYSIYGLPFCPLIGFGEDLSFCIRARGLEYKIFCDTKIKFGHLGKMIIDESKYDAMRELIKQQEVLNGTTDNNTEN